ncbi:hypothetical protein RHSIM_Rhsim09G0046500 [Rhododendron simsii]|uniref:Dirigent protein n=1 Tax=Rhododendron simsii TaxID=118357 RepID=A0A834LDW1_RHOSS|nr:hypothetical protein RHSIM_Rhsim09G0046500 [Rhododendron simsii]
MGDAADAVVVRVVEAKRRSSEVSPWDGLPGNLEQKSVEFSEKRKESLRARYLYGIIFLLANLIAWCDRDYGQKLSPLLHCKLRIPSPYYLKACGIGGHDCFQTMGVLRIFFFIMFVTTCNTSKLHETRNMWHSRWWPVKFIMLVVSLIIPFFVPSDFVQLYGELARVGVGIFLILQLISVIEFITWWNNYWMPDERKNHSRFLGLFTSTVFYIASVCGIGVMYSHYVPRPSCTLNIFFLSWTTILLLVMMVISLHSKGFIIAICAIVMATFSTGIDSQTFQQPTPSVFIAMLVASLLHMVAAVDPATTRPGAVRQTSRVPPPKGGVAIPNANGALPTVSINGVPLGTGLAGTTFAGNSNNNGRLFATQLGPDGLGLGFGTITVIDDIMTSSPEFGSQSLGKAQGIYVASSADGSTQMMAFTVMMEGGEYGDSLNFFGVYKIGSIMSKLSLTGGTGKYKNACGFAEVRSLIPAGQHVTDGVETLLRITVHLKYGN